MFENPLQPFFEKLQMHNSQNHVDLGILTIKGTFLRLRFLRFYSFQITIDNGFIVFLSDCAANIFSLFTF